MDCECVPPVFALFSRVNCRYIRLLDQVIEYQINTIGHVDANVMSFSADSYVRHDVKKDTMKMRCRTPSVASSCSSLCDADSCADDFLS